MTTGFRITLFLLCVVNCMLSYLKFESNKTNFTIIIIKKNTII
jgi:hypothetical protein